MHRLLRVLSTSLITAGLVVLADVGLTLAWQEPVSSIYGSLQQGKAEAELEDLEARFPSPEDLEALERVDEPTERARLLADRFAEEVTRGEGIARLRIDRIGLDIVVVEGTDTDSLRKGPGHYTRDDGIGNPDRGDGSAFPGQGETVGIAGHRTTYLAPFRRIDEIEDGDELVVEMPYATFTYEVEKHEIVSPGETQVVRNVGYERLVLTACHPLYSAAQRYVVFGKLSEVSFFAAGDRVWQDP
jgi:sortase A